MNADAVISAARETVGTPFAHQGRIFCTALDCAGVAAHVATRLGIFFVDWPAYSRTPHGGLLELALDSQECLRRIPVISDRRPGDILLMRLGRDPQHLAIFTGTTIIHAYQVIGRVCEHELSSEWIARIARVYRFRGVR